MTWEIAFCRDDDSRLVLSAGVPSRELAASIPPSKDWTAFGTPAALMLTRTDWTPEARKRKWESDFYSFVQYKNGTIAKRRRTPAPQIEKEWQQWVVSEKKAEMARKARNKIQ